MDDFLVRPKNPWRMAATACALLVLQASGFLHIALVPHVYCAEHGELTEAGETAAHAQVTPSLASPPSDAPEFGAVSAAVSAGEHEHCTAVCRLSALLGERAESLAPTGVFTRDVEVDERGFGQGELLGVAPKQSPPALV
jgi:hypothetical protein